MNKKNVVIILIASVVLLFGLIYKVEVVSSQRAMPGTGPLRSRSDVVAVAQTVANINSTSPVQNRPSLESLQNISPTEFREIQTDQFGLGYQNSLALFNVDGDLALSKIIWIVTFRGAFSPRKSPPGVLVPMYSLIDVILDARDGSVIGIHMSD